MFLRTPDHKSRQITALLSATTLAKLRTFLHKTGIAIAGHRGWFGRISLFHK